MFSQHRQGGQALPRPDRATARPFPGPNRTRCERCQRWRKATKLILEQADVAAVSHQVHLVLFYDAQLDIKAIR
jgi:hypothetical protein